MSRKNPFLRVFYVLLISNLLLWSGCALLRLPENVESIADNAKEIKNNTNGIFKGTVTDPAVIAEWSAEKKRLQQERENRDSGEETWWQILLGLASSLPGAYGAGAAAVLTLLYKWFQTRKAAQQEAAKKEAAMDATDIALKEIPPGRQEDVKRDMKLAAIGRDVYSAVRADLKKRKDAKSKEVR